MRPSTIRYFLKEGFSGLKKNLLMTVASIIAVAACISISVDCFGCKVALVE